MFCGWIVLGPYHTKFRTITSTFETMFGLINGDDMYATFANIETESIYIWMFSEIYLYSFVCLFIFVISSLVIALIIDGYDTVKVYKIFLFDCFLYLSKIIFRNIILMDFQKVVYKNLVKKMYHIGQVHKSVKI